MSKNNTLMFRITNNRKKAELALGFRISEEELTDILSGSPGQKNRQLASLVFIWQGKIESIKLDLLKDMNATQDPKEIKIFT
ncbi:hypothetical protein [Duncaniella muris]|nr:hypothetical protein [Duncaniella muris]